MNTKALMVSSAIFLGALGLAASFLPVEILGFLDELAHHRLEAVLVQLLGALMIGFAMLNWMAKGAALGGIYGRPIVAANLVHFTVGAIALVKVAALGDMPPGAILLTVAYVLFAVWFGATMFGRGPIGAIEHAGPG